MHFVLLFIALMSGWTLCQSDLADQAIEMGRSQYQMIQQDSKLPRFGTCWQKAIEDLHAGCRQLTDDVQARLALAFANCFLIKSGLKSYKCDQHVKIADCLRDIDNNAFTAYSNFFTHTHNMCQFLQAQIWRQKTEETISNLSENSARVAESLVESARIQDSIVLNQRQTLEYQRQIVDNGGVLSQAIEMSKSNVREMLQEFRDSTDEQRALIFSIFDRVAKLQNLVISEVSWIYTMIFYGVTMIVLYLVTATKRTAEARLYLFLILTINFVLERLICSLSLPDEHHEPVGQVSEVINERIWMLRKISLLISFAVLTYFAINFTDYNVINNKLLLDICRQNKELCQAIEIIKRSQPLSGLAAEDHTDTIGILYDDTGKFNEKDDVSDSDESTNSFDSNQSDRTWLSSRINTDLIDDEEDDLDDDGVVEDFSFLEEDYFTAANNSPSGSGQTTPTNRGSRDGDPVTSYNDDQRDLLNRSCHDLVLPQDVTGNYGLKSSRRPSRRGGWADESRSSRQRAPQPVLHSYNLRRRRPNLDVENPILDSESPNSFGKLVSKLSHITQKNSWLIRQKFQELNQVDENLKESKLRTTSTAAFSSDEDH